MKKYWGLIVAGILMLMYGATYIILDYDYHQVRKEYYEEYEVQTGIWQYTCDEVINVYKDDLEQDGRIIIHCIHYNETGTQRKFLVKGLFEEENDELDTPYDVDIYRYLEPVPEEPESYLSEYKSLLESLDQSDELFTVKDYKRIETSRNVLLLGASIVLLPSLFFLLRGDNEITFYKRKG